MTLTGFQTSGGQRHYDVPCVLLIQPLDLPIQTLLVPWHDHNKGSSFHYQLLLTLLHDLLKYLSNSQNNKNFNFETSASMFKNLTNGILQNIIHYNSLKIKLFKLFFHFIWFKLGKDDFSQIHEIISKVFWKLNKMNHNLLSNYPNKVFTFSCLGLVAPRPKPFGRTTGSIVFTTF